MEKLNILPAVCILLGFIFAVIAGFLMGTIIGFCVLSIGFIVLGVILAIDIDAVTDENEGVE